jgi:hypothetical protein
MTIDLILISFLKASSQAEWMIVVVSSVQLFLSVTTVALVIYSLKIQAKIFNKQMEATDSQLVLDKLNYDRYIDEIRPVVTCQLEVFADLSGGNLILEIKRNPLANFVGFYINNELITYDFGKNIFKSETINVDTPIIIPFAIDKKLPQLDFESLKKLEVGMQINYSDRMGNIYSHTIVGTLKEQMVVLRPKIIKKVPLVGGAFPA